MTVQADAAPGRPDAPILLLTKLHSPVLPAQTVVRERLFARLNEGRGRRLSLVASLAGFGKSTLLTLPLLRPIVAVLVVFSTIWDFKTFDQIYVMATGVPDRAADTAAVTAYRESSALGHYGVGSAVAVVLFLVLLAFSILYVRMIGREART